MDYIVRIIPALLRGAGVTLALFALVLPLSLPLGFLVTLCTTCRFKPVKWLAEAYIFVLRGTPLMLQLFFFYYGLPFLPGIGPYLRLSSFAASALSVVRMYRMPRITARRNPSAVSPLASSQLSFAM